MAGGGMALVELVLLALGMLLGVGAQGTTSCNETSEWYAMRVNAARLEDLNGLDYTLYTNATGVFTEFVEGDCVSRQNVTAVRIVLSPTSTVPRSFTVEARKSDANFANTVGNFRIMVALNYDWPSRDEVFLTLLDPSSQYYNKEGPVTDAPYDPLVLSVTSGQPWSYTLPDSLFSQVNVGVYGYSIEAVGTRRGDFLQSTLPLASWVQLPLDGYTLSSPRVTFEGTVLNPSSGFHELNIRLAAVDFHRARAFKWLVLNVLPAAPTVLGTLPDQEVNINETISFTLPPLETLFQANHPSPDLRFEVTYVHNSNDSAALHSNGTAVDLPPWLSYDNDTRTMTGLRSALPVGVDIVNTTLAVVAFDLDGRTAEVRWELRVIRCPGWRFLRISSVSHANDLRVCSEWYNTQASSLVQWMRPDGSFINILEDTTIVAEERSEPVYQVTNTLGNFQQCPSAYGTPLAVRVLPCAVPSVNANLESFAIQATASLVEPVLWDTIVLAVGSDEEVRRRSDSPPLTLSTIASVKITPFNTTCKYQYIRIPEFGTSKVGLQWVDAAGAAIDYVPKSCINAVAIIVRVEKNAPKPAAFTIEGYTYDTVDGEPAWEALSTQSGLTWPVPILKVAVNGTSLPIPGPQPGINTAYLPLPDFNVTRNQNGAYELPPRLLRPAAPSITGFMWYGRLSDSGAALPTWLSVNRFTGTVRASGAGYEGTELETAVTRTANLTLTAVDAQGNILTVSLLVRVLPASPVLQRPIANQRVVLGRLQRFDLPDDTFQINSPVHSLALRADLVERQVDNIADKLPLPSWITFNDVDLYFEFSPTLLGVEAGVYEVAVRAELVDGSMYIEDWFEVQVVDECVDGFNFFRVISTLSASEAAACAVELQSATGAAAASNSLLFWRPDFTYRYNISFGGLDYSGPLPDFNPNNAFTGPPVLFTVPNVRITYIANLTDMNARTMLLGNLDMEGNAIISTDIVEVRVLWSPEDSVDFVLTTQIRVGSTVEVYADVVAVLRAEHVVRVASSLSPVGQIDTVTTPIGLLLPSGTQSTSTFVTLGDAARCFRPRFVNLTHCVTPGAGPLVEYVVQGRREVEGSEQGPWRTLAHVLERPDRLPALATFGIPVNLTAAGSRPSPPLATDASQCDYTSIVAVGLPFDSFSFLLWTDATGATYAYEAGQCLNGILELVIIYGRHPSTTTTGSVPNQPPPPFIIEGRGGRLGTGVVASVTDAPRALVSRFPSDAATPGELTALSALTAALQPISGPPIPPQTIYTGLEADPFRLTVPEGAFINAGSPELHGFIYTARQLITTGEPSPLPVWLKFDGLTLSVEPFYWKNVPYIDEFFSVEITATNAYGYSATQIIPFQVKDMPPNVIGSVADLEMDHRRPLLIPLSTRSLFQSNLRDDLLTVSVGLWDKRPLLLPDDDPEAIANSTVRPLDAGDSLFDLPTFLSYDADRQQLTGTPQDGDYGQFDIVVRAFDSIGQSAEVRFTIIVHNGCWEGFRFLRVQTTRASERSKLVPCAEQWGERFVTWKPNTTDDGTLTIPNSISVNVTELSNIPDQPSYVQVGGLDSCIRPVQLHVQQCGYPNGFGFFSLVHSRTGEEGSFIPVGYVTARTIEYGIFSRFFVSSIEQLIPTEVLSACLSPVGLNAVRYVDGEVMLAQAGDTLEITVQTSRAEQTKPRIYLGGLQAEVTGSGRDWVGTVRVVGSIQQGKPDVRIEVDDNSQNSVTLASAQTPECPFQVSVDTVLPDVAMTWLPENYTREDSFTLMVTPTEGLSGFSAESVVLTNAGLAGNVSREGLSYLLPVRASAEGEVTATLGVNAVADLAGNGNPTARSASTVYDASAPWIADLAGRASELGDVILDWAGVDEVSSVSTFLCAHSSPPGQPVIFTPYTECTPPALMGRQTRAGRSVLQVFAVDAAGNFEYPPMNISWTTAANGTVTIEGDILPPPSTPTPTMTPTPTDEAIDVTTAPLPAPVETATPAFTATSPTLISTSTTTPSETVTTPDVHFPTPTSRPDALMDMVVELRLALSGGDEDSGIVVPTSENVEDVIEALQSMGDLVFTRTSHDDSPALIAKLIVTLGESIDPPLLRNALSTEVALALSLAQEQVTVIPPSIASQRSLDARRKLLQPLQQDWTIVLEGTGVADVGVDALDALLDSADFLQRVQATVPQVQVIASDGASRVGLVSTVRLFGTFDSAAAASEAASVVDTLILTEAVANAAGLTDAGLSLLLLGDISTSSSTPVPTAAPSSTPIPSTAVPKPVITTSAPTTSPTTPATIPPSPSTTTTTTTPTAPLTEPDIDNNGEDEIDMTVIIAVSVTGGAVLLVAALVAGVIMRRWRLESQRIGSSSMGSRGLLLEGGVSNSP